LTETDSLAGSSHSLVEYVIYVYLFKEYIWISKFNINLVIIVVADAFRHVRVRVWVKALPGTGMIGDSLLCGQV
jgi:hypothetical protein